jgi:hypothetical protein
VTSLESPLLIRYAGGRNIYYVSSWGQKHELRDLKTMQRFGLSLDMVSTIQDKGLFESIPDGIGLNSRTKALPGSEI